MTSSMDFNGLHTDLLKEGTYLSNANTYHVDDFWVFVNLKGISVRQDYSQETP